MRAVSILLPALLLCSARFAAGEVELTVIYTGDTHAALYPCDCPFESDGGIARRATMIRRIRKQAQGSVLLVDAGGAVAGGLYDEYSVSPELDSLRQEYYLKALAEMAYDASRRRVVLFGGRNSSTGVSDQLWEWDGANWTQLCGADTACAGPSARQDTGIVYDTARDMLVLVGGYGDGGFIDDVWEWGQHCQ